MLNAKEINVMSITARENVEKVDAEMIKAYCEKIIEPQLIEVANKGENYLQIECGLEMQNALVQELRANGYAVAKNGGNLIDIRWGV
jgi:hypothetical protein